MEARIVTYLELTHRVQNLIRNIDELSYFTSLETLKIRHACEESLSLIMPNYAKLKEVEIALQKFDNINLSNCKYLEKISGFQATKIINLSGCVALKEVGLTAPDIDVSGCSMLEVLGVSTNFLNVTGCTALKELSIGGSLNTIDLSSLIALEKFDCSGYGGLTSLDVSKNTALKELYCSGNQLTSLDLSNNKALEWLGCINPLQKLI